MRFLTFQANIKLRATHEPIISQSPQARDWSPACANHVELMIRTDNCTYLNNRKGFNPTNKIIKIIITSGVYW